MLIQRYADAIKVHANTMKTLYSKLEALQGDVAVTRSARQSITYIYTDTCYSAFRQTVCISILFTVFIICILVRPEQQKEMLQLCASCTRTDVALNNLVVRSRLRTKSMSKFLQRQPASPQERQSGERHWRWGSQETKRHWHRGSQAKGL